jgi:hypothetical protein
MSNHEDKKEQKMEEHDSSAEFDNVIELKAKLSGSKLSIEELEENVPENLELIGGRIEGRFKMFEALLYNIGIKSAVKFAPKELWEAALKELDDSGRDKKYFNANLRDASDMKRLSDEARAKTVNIEEKAAQHLKTVMETIEYSCSIGKYEAYPLLHQEPVRDQEIYERVTEILREKGYKVELLCRDELSQLDVSWN